MNNKLVFASVLFFALSLSLVFAQEVSPAQVENPSEPQVTAVQVEPEVPVEEMTITLVSPSNNAVFDLSAEGESIDIMFNFLVQPMDNGSTCTLNVQSTNEVIINAEVIDNGQGTATGTFGAGNYEWTVVCANNMGDTFESSTNSFEIRNPQVSNNGGNTNSNNNEEQPEEEEGNNRRLRAQQLVLQELNNPTTEETSSDESSNSPGITGAVVGAFGNKGALGFGILLVAIGVVGLFVYNRQRLGVVRRK